jgi:hypothetical protein
LVDKYNFKDHYKNGQEDLGTFSILYTLPIHELKKGVNWVTLLVDVDLNISLGSEPGFHPILQADSLTACPD